MNKLLKVSNLTKKFFTKDKEVIALNDISFEIMEKEIVSILGPSGCGKSTILSILSNLESKTSGDIKFRHGVKVAVMFQKDCLFDYLTVLENCMLGLKIQKLDTKENKEYVINLLNKYGLSEFINEHPKNLSGGMRQRVALIRTLALKPDILMLDEAFSALDYATRLMVSDDIYKIIKNEGLTAIIVTHDIAEAISMSNRVIMLSKRPSSIKNIYDIQLNNKSTPIDNRKDTKFAYYYDKLWKDLDKVE